jgi:hypothetical protein
MQTGLGEKVTKFATFAIAPFRTSSIQNVTQMQQNKSMKLTPGELYFIGELDHLTGEQTPFFKIGIVRADESRTSADRLQEHQTGNPRPLFIHHVIATEVVERVETLMHRLHAKHRGSGEWFQFDLDQLQDAINTAQNLSIEAAENSEILQKAAELTKTLSTDVVLPVTEEIRELRNEHLLADMTVKKFKEVDSELRNVLREAIAKGESVGGAARERKISFKDEFNEELFKSENADLYARYVFIEQRLSGRFDPKKLKDTSHIDSQLKDKVEPIIAEIREAIENAKANKIPKSELNKWFLVIRENSAMAEWSKEIAEARLRVAVGTSAGIEGICSWVRKMVEKPRFDEDKFMEENFELYKHYLELKQVGGGLEMAPGQAQGAAVDSDPVAVEE